MIEVSQELLAFLRTEYDRCRDDTLDDERAAAIDFYNGELFGDEEDGRSQLVTRDVAEVIDYMVISILRTLVSGDRVVDFTPRRADQQQMAQEATEVITHLFMEEQNGYLILHDWLKAGLLEKNAVAMTYPEPQPAKRVEKIVPDVLLGEIEAIEAEETGEFDEMGDAMFRVVVLEEQPPKFCDHAVPNEEFYCSPDARTIQEAAIKGRKVRKTISELVELGFDRDELEDIGSEHDCDSILDDARDQNRWVDANDRKGANRVIWWHEEFVRFDENGDGIAELLFVQGPQGKPFAVTEMESDEDHPFEDWCPFPMPHRRIGQSLADKVMDIQRTRSVLMRQAMDNLYQSNSPRVTVSEDSMGDSTIDDLLTVRPGALIRHKGQFAPQPFKVPFTAGDSFNAMEILAGERESRTGITRLNQGLDAEALNKTATGTALMQAQGQQVEEYLARNFANALARLFTKKLRLLKRYGRPIELQIDGEFKQVDPSQWPEDMIARPRVGLGSGRKEQRLQYRQAVLELQKECMMNGLPIVGPEQIYNSAKGAIADMGLGHVSDYFVDPATIQQDPNQQPAPDPEAMAAQAEQERQQAEAEHAAMLREADLQHKQQMAEVEKRIRSQEGAEKLAQMRAEREEAAIQARQRIEDEYRLGLLKQGREQDLAERKMQIEERLAQSRMAREAQMADAKMSQNRPGGDLDK